MSIYRNKIAHLVSLIAQIKEFSSQKINDTFEIEAVEEILDIDWENECLKNQKAFLFFLNTYISVYEKVLEHLQKMDTTTFKTLFV